MGLGVWSYYKNPCLMHNMDLCHNKNSLKLCNSFLDRISVSYGYLALRSAETSNRSQKFVRAEMCLKNFFCHLNSISLLIQVEEDADNTQICNYSSYTHLVCYIFFLINDSTILSPCTWLMLQGSILWVILSLGTA